MKKLLLTLPLVGLLIAGCTTVPNQPKPVLDPMVATGIRTTLAVAVPLVSARDANAAPYFQAVSVVFRAAAQNGQYDPTVIQATLDRISVRELHDPTAQQIILTAFAAYKAALADVISLKLGQSTYGPFIQSILVAVADGIDAGVSVKLQTVDYGTAQPAAE